MEPDWQTTIPAKLGAVHARIQAAATAADRDPASVRLMCVSKTKPRAAVLAAYAAGERLFGENRPQALAARMEDDWPEDLIWHYVGPLQTNKVRPVVEIADAIHSVHKLKLLRRIDRIAGEAGRRPAVFIQVNVAGEDQKQGFAPTAIPELCEVLPTFANVTIAGFMTMAPYGAPESELRAVFCGLRNLAEDARQRSGLPLPELSMGMSNDFEIAIAEGATLVRVGTDIFGERARTG